MVTITVDEWLYRFLSDDLDSRSYGRPCDHYRIALRDQKRQTHPVIVDVKCRKPLFNASAQTAARLAHQLLGYGVKRLRIEVVCENAEQTMWGLESYQGLNQGILTPDQAFNQLKVHESFGLTTGMMEVHR